MKLFFPEAPANLFVPHWPEGILQMGSVNWFKTMIIHT